MGIQCCRPLEEDLEMAAFATRRRVMSQVSREQQDNLWKEYFDAENKYLEVCEKFKKIDPEVGLEIRTYGSPPELLYHCFVCMALLLGESDTEWENIRRFLFKSNSKLLAFDFDTTPPECIRRAQQYADTIPDLDDAEKVRHAGEMGYLVQQWFQSIFRMAETREELTLALNNATPLGTPRGAGSPRS